MFYVFRHSKNANLLGPRVSQLFCEVTVLSSFQTRKQSHTVPTQVLARSSAVAVIADRTAYYIAAESCLE